MPEPPDIPEPPPEPGAPIAPSPMVRVGPTNGTQAAVNERRARQLEADMTRFNADVDAMVNASKLSTTSQRYKAWRNFAGRYVHYLKTVSDWGSPVVNPTLDQFNTDFRSWFTWYRRAFGINPSAREPKPDERDDSNPVQMPAGAWALFAVFGLYAIAKAAGK